MTIDLDGESILCLHTVLAGPRAVFSCAMCAAGIDRGARIAASNLVLPTIGLLDARDPRFRTTLGHRGRSWRATA